MPIFQGKLSKEQTQALHHKLHGTHEVQARTKSQTRQDIPAKLTGFVNSLHSQMLAFRPSMKFQIPEPIDRPRLRGSDLPCCPMKISLDTVREVQRTQYATCMSDYYTRVGSEYHAVIQKWFGVSGCMWGKYFCPSCKTLYPLGSKQDDNSGMLGPVFCTCENTKREQSKRKAVGKLPVCCEYVELEPFGTDGAAAFRGHADAVLKIDGKYLIGEFKTTSSSKIQKRKKEGPDHKHVLQVTAYRCVMPEFLAMPEAMWWQHSLVMYYDRANPKNNVVCCIPHEPDLFDREVKVFNKTLKHIAKKRYSKIRGICKASEDAPFCPYVTLCFSPQRDELVNEILPGYMRVKSL